MPRERAAAAAASRFSTLNAPRSRDRISIPSIVNADAVAVDDHVESPQVGLGRDAERRGGDLEVAQQPASERIVHVHDGPTRVIRREEPRLGLEVRIHRAVVVEMVLRQVREDRRIEHDAVDPLLLERMRRHLERRTSNAGVAHPCQQALEVGRLRRGAHEGNRFTRHARPGRPHDAGGPPGSVEDRGEQIRDGGLAVRAGHRDGRHRGRGMAERRGGHRPHRAANGRNERLRRLDVEPTLHDERRRTGVHRLRCDRRGHRRAGRERRRRRLPV